MRNTYKAEINQAWCPVGLNSTRKGANSNCRVQTHRTRLISVMVTEVREAERSRLGGEDSTIWGNVEFEVLLGIRIRLYNSFLTFKSSIYKG